MVKLLVSIRQPKNMMILHSPPSAIILRIDAGSGLLIGSRRPASGLKMRKRAMTTAYAARATILQFDDESRTAHAPSSMYPSVPPRIEGFSLTSASSAEPKGILSFCRCGGGSSFA